MNDFSTDIVEMLQRLMHGVEMYKMSTLYLAAFAILGVATTIGSLIT